MDTFVGTKMVNATPMTRAEYNDFRGWQLPADENGADEGYLVEYLDGGKPNTPQYASYVSWSPKVQFEAAYLHVGDIDHLPPHQQRVIGEKAQLDDRLAKLRAFLSGPAPGLVAADELARLENQVAAMTQYTMTLAQRIAAFS